MNVSDIMTKKIVTVPPTAPLSRLWRSIFVHSINAIPVVDKNKELLGLITREDILKSLYPDYQDMLAGIPDAADFEKMEKVVRESGGKKSRNIMNPRVIYTRMTTPVMRALSRMIVRNVDQLPVLDEEDKVVGMITKGDIFNALFQSNFPLKTQKRTKKRKKS